MKRYFLWISIVFFISSCSQATYNITNTPDYSPEATLTASLVTRGTEIPTPSPIKSTPAIYPVCNLTELYIEIDTMPSPPQGSAIIRVVLYLQKEDYACRVETLVNFKLEDENGDLLPIEGNNGLALSKGYVLAKHASYIYGVGAVWSWHNYCQKVKTNIILVGSAAGLQTEKVIRAIPSCFDEKVGSHIDPYTVNINDQLTVEWLGTATPVP